MINYLCAYEESNRQTDSETSTKIIFGPQIVGHVLDDGPIGLALLLVGNGLLC
jgi:hypothetical protein